MKDDKKSKAKQEIARLEALLLTDEVKNNPQAKRSTLALIAALKRLHSIK